MKKKGFTLIELIVVIAIIGVLAAILVPAMLGYVKKSKITTCNTTAKSIYNAYNTAIVDLDTGKGYSSLAAATSLVKSTYFTDFSSSTITSRAVSDTGKNVDGAAVVQGSYCGNYPNPMTVDDFSAGTLAEAETQAAKDAGCTGKWAEVS